MARLILLVALMGLGGLSLYYFGDGIFDCQYGSSKTAKLLEQINDLPPTAAGDPQ